MKTLEELQQKNTELESLLKAEHDIEELLTEMDGIDSISDLFMFIFKRVPKLIEEPFRYHFIHVEEQYRREDDIRNLAHIFRKSLRDFFTNHELAADFTKTERVVLHAGGTFEFNLEKEYLPIIIENAFIGTKKPENKNVLLGYIEMDSSKDSRHTAEKRTRIIRKIMRSARTHLERIRSHILMEEHSFLAYQDHLTEIFNRRGFFRQCKIVRVEQGSRSWGLIGMDLDHFKRINDTYGHLDGDHALKYAVKTVQEVLSIAKEAGLRPVFGRMGGEEFAIYLHSIQRKEVQEIAELMRSALERGTFQTDNGSPLRITGSFGTYFSELDESVESGLAKADIALYLAKNNGRNRVEPFKPSQLETSTSLLENIPIRHVEDFPIKKS